jgi:hypothetical protein
MFSSSKKSGAEEQDIIRWILKSILNSFLLMSEIDKNSQKNSQEKILEIRRSIQLVQEVGDINDSTLKLISTLIQESLNDLFVDQNFLMQAIRTFGNCDTSKPIPTNVLYDYAIEYVERICKAAILNAPKKNSLNPRQTFQRGI